MDQKYHDRMAIETSGFPTPAEIEAARRVDVGPEVSTALAKIRAHLIKHGPGNVPMDWPSDPTQKEIARILGASGWSIRWDSDQREGTWATVLAR